MHVYTYVYTCSQAHHAHTYTYAPTDIELQGGAVVGQGSGRKGSEVSSGLDRRCSLGYRSWFLHTSDSDLQWRSIETTCLLSLQTCVWSGRHPILSERCPAPHTALSQHGCLAPLLPHRGRGLGAGLPDPDGLLTLHPNAFQSTDSSDTGAKWDFRLAEETAFAQVLPCL